MEGAFCTDCQEFVDKRRVEDGYGGYIIKQACDCTQAPHDAMPYEVDGWEWASIDG